MAPSERARQALTAARTDPAAAHQLAGWYEGGKEGLHQAVELAFRQGLAGELLATSYGHRTSFDPCNEGSKRGG
jgi:hypothetical protein